jgi:phosphate transport system permease protein
MTRLTALDLRVAPRRRRREGLVRLAFGGAAGLTVVISAAIVLSLIGNAVSFIVKVDLGTLWSDGWFPRRGLYDIKTIMAGTVIIAGIAMLVAAPLGIATALYLSEYAGRAAC